MGGKDPTLGGREYPCPPWLYPATSFSCRKGEPEGWYTVPVYALGSWDKHKEGDHKGWFMMSITALGSWEKHREGDPEGWSTMIITALDSWEKLINSAGKNRSHY
jgi:hypothetical protein